MNIRKNVDYSEMYAALDQIMTVQMPQMELYSEIGRVVCHRTEKGAAVAAADYLSEHYPDVKGFSPRNIRRMRDFYRTYANRPTMLSLAMQLGWTQNVVILEADLSMEQRDWYLKAAMQFGWSKAELLVHIANSSHEKIMLDFEQKVCDNEAVSNNRPVTHRAYSAAKVFQPILHSHRYRDKLRRTAAYPTIPIKPIVFMLC